MKNKKKILIIVISVIVLAVLLILFFCNFYLNSDKSSNSTTDSIDKSINIDNNEEIDWSKYPSFNYELTESITIKDAGIYNLTGTLNNGVITIDTTSNVKVVLNNVNITNENGPAIYVANAENVFVNIADGTSNYLADGVTYTGYEEDEIGTIFSHDDITFEGNGTLEVKANKEDAIVSKDDLEITSGNYIINSIDDGIRGKDSVYIKNGTFEINSDGDAIKSTNDTDAQKGYVSIENGTFNINAKLDGIQSQTKLLVQNGTFNITTGGGSKTSSTQDSWGKWGTSSSSESSSAKGLKSVDNLVVENGTFTFNTSDDSIHCNNYVGIKNATLSISSGDDGIHADTELIIDSGKIDITKSYEGIEASKITINGGSINIVASDDGINVAGGNDSSAMDRRGQNNFSSNTNNILTVNDGIIYVNATGDGIDVNGSAYINGGETKVDGPTNNGNAALDYDNVFEVNGGTVIAGGSNGMLQGCSSTSKVYNVTISFTSNYSSNDVISIVDSSGNEIVSYKSAKTYSSLVVASPNLKNGENYTIKVNNSNYKTFTISSITTSIGNSMGNPGGGMPGGNRGR